MNELKNATKRIYENEENAEDADNYNDNSTESMNSDDTT